MAFYEADTTWHEGEAEIHKLMRNPHIDYPTQPYLTPMAGSRLTQAPLIAIGTLDDEGRPWTALWGGEPGFAKPIAQSIIGIKTTVDREFDPVVKVLLGDNTDGEVVQEKGTGRMVAVLAINLQTRLRVKLYGRMVAGALSATETSIGEVQLVVKIEQSLGNCPKYLNKKRIIPHVPEPKLITSTFPIPSSAMDLIKQADLFFISSSNHNSDMDTNHRGGSPGFVRVLSSDENGLTLVYPEYSGNRFYQTLGNLWTTPKAGVMIPDFKSGDVLYLSGTTEILTGKAAKDLIAHTNLAVKIQVETMRYVSSGLAFRGQEGEYSPYNPPVRYLSSEKGLRLGESSNKVTAKLVDKKIFTPDIGRFRFHVDDPKTAGKWKPGQYVALSFAEELDVGYQHMREDDPKSLNDDFLRTFTISSSHGEVDKYDQFEITIRKVGVATDFLFKHNPRAGLELGLQGFGGEFYITQDAEEHVAFIAGGLGITPLMAQAPNLDLGRLTLYWTVRSDDLALVLDTFSNIASLAESTKLFVTGKADEDSEAWKVLRESGANVHKRRMTRDDLKGDVVARYYLCTGLAFKNTLLEWLGSKTVVYEDFNY